MWVQRSQRRRTWLTVTAVTCRLSPGTAGGRVLKGNKVSTEPRYQVKSNPFHGGHNGHCPVPFVMLRTHSGRQEQRKNLKVWQSHLLTEGVVHFCYSPPCIANRQNDSFTPLPPPEGAKRVGEKCGVTTPSVKFPFWGRNVLL